MSGDGAWQKKGHSLLNGVVTLIGNGKCIDYEVLLKKCKSCEAWECKKEMDIVDRNDWKVRHVCSINHTGSAGALKVVGMQKMFSRSVNLHGVRYTFYIGDGDTKSLDHICKSGPYLGHTITKAECVGHLQKRCQCQFAMSRANIKGKSSLTAKVLVAVKDA